MNKSVKTFDELNHQYTLEDNLHQSDAHMIFTMGEQPPDLVVFKQRRKTKMAYT